MTDIVPIRRALISVSDKTGLVEFGRALARTRGAKQMHAEAEEDGDDQAGHERNLGHPAAGGRQRGGGGIHLVDEGPGECGRAYRAHGARRHI